MGRIDVDRPSQDELSELVLRPRRPEKTSRTPSTDRKERREQSRPGSVEPGHEGRRRVPPRARRDRRRGS